MQRGGGRGGNWSWSEWGLEAEGELEVGIGREGIGSKREWGLVEKLELEVGVEMGVEGKAEVKKKRKGIRKWS